MSADPGWPWSELGMAEASRDQGEIRRSYARRLKTIDQAHEIARFETLREAYADARALASAPPPRRLRRWRRDRPIQPSRPAEHPLPRARGHRTLPLPPKARQSLPPCRRSWTARARTRTSASGSCRCC